MKETLAQIAGTLILLAVPLLGSGRRRHR